MFTALLVWLTAVSSFRGALPSQSRLLDVDGSGVATLSITVPRVAVTAIRPASRASPPPAADLAFLPAAQTAADAARPARHDAVRLASVRLAHGTARTYDATAPPPQTR